MKILDTRNKKSGGFSRRVLLKGGAALAALTTVAAGASFAQAAPKQGGTLRISQTADIQPGNILAGRGGNNAFRHNVFDTLTVLDATTGQPRAVLATEWESSNDNKTFVVRIRDDVTFHSGRPMTAEDVVCTFEQIKVPENSSQMRPLVSEWTSMTATGPHEVTITSDKAIAPRVFDVFQLATIVDKETFAGLKDASTVVGTGPFKFESWVPGATVRLVANESYWGGRPYLDAIELNVINDPTALANSIRGRADLVLELTPRDQIMFQGDASVELFSGPGGAFHPMGIDVTKPPFDNKSLRQAFGFAIDRERILDQVFSGQGEVSNLWWRSNEPGTTEELRNHYSYDPDRARALIAEAGAEGVDVPIKVIGFGSTPAVYEIIQNNLREVGLNPVGEVLETAAFDQGQTAGELGPVFVQIHGLQGFSAATLVDAFPALRPNNPSKFDPPRYRELKDALQAAQGEQAYAAALQELATFMLDEAFSHVVIKTVPLHAKLPGVMDLDFDNVGYLHLGKAWIDA